MFFVCPGCQQVLAVPAEKVPPRPMKYTCKGCGTVSALQDNLHQTRPGRAGPGHAGEGDLPSESVVGTVYHNVSELGANEAPAATYQLLCLVKAGDDSVSRHSFLGERVTIGRRGADLVIKDPLVSRAHAVLERVLDRVVLKDLGSTNGTFLNEQKVTAEVVERDDVIRIGNTAIKVTVRVT